MYSTGPEQGKLSPGGISVIEDRLQSAQHKAGQIWEVLSQIESRMFAPRPSPVSATTAGADHVPQSVENSLNMLNSALAEIEKLAARILQG
jgi:hypothetical protein